MRNLDKALAWLKRAKSNLARAKVGKVSEDILYEDLCFDSQQAVEKAFKAICIINDIRFKKAHDISYLVDLLENGNIVVPEELQKAKILTDYAVELRYPGDYPPVDENMYKDAIEIAEAVVSWAETELKIAKNSKPEG